jgi:hypothetical protein
VCVCVCVCARVLSHTCTSEHVHLPEVSPPCVPGPRVFSCASVCLHPRVCVLGWYLYVCLSSQAPFRLGVWGAEEEDIWVLPSPTSKPAINRKLGGREGTSTL